MLSLVVGTFASEDLACITAGLLIQQGIVGPVRAVTACALGIWVGDLGLWALGRAGGRTAARWPAVAQRLKKGATGEVVAWLQRHAGHTLLAGRFLPGTRLPLYVTAGFVGLPLRVFASWALLAVVLWTPPLVLFTAWLGSAYTTSVARPIGPWWTGAAVVVSVLTVLHLIRTVSTPATRSRVTVRLARWSRWEFWPMWLFYAPVACWVAVLAIRYRGITTITAANPGMPDGGTVGESKAAILSQLPPEWIVPTVALPEGDTEERLARLVEHMRAASWDFPVILKPDVGQRGVGVRLVRSVEEASAYLRAEPLEVIAQPFHPGPYEAGVFYYRFPGWARGRIFSITDKHFPVVVGDGRSTLSALIWAHPRYRLQADTFLERHRHHARRVPASGERVQLGIAGNHALGTLFRDGSHLCTQALERRIDDIARSFPGFYVGRFDIRYSNVEAFKRGEDLAIVELNGATAESTNIYDPDRSLVSAYRQLFRQWSIVFAIGAANRSNGAAVSSRRRLLTLVRAHLTSKVAYQISD